MTDSTFIIKLFFSSPIVEINPSLNSAKLTAGVDEREKMRFAFDIYDVDKDGMISNGELFGVMKMMVGNNLNDQQVNIRNDHKNLLSKYN